jgi:D-alanine-D-alanine ligase
MRVAIIYNSDCSGVINTFGMQNKEIYNPKTVKMVAESLEKGGHNVEIIDGNMDVIEKIRNFLPRVKEGEKFGLVFNMAYGIQGESRYTHIPAMLEMLGIPYVGSSPAGHAIALDKVITKIILQKNNIPTPDFWTFSSSEEDMTDVEFPVIIKPKMESVSFGLRVVDNIEDLKEAVDFIVAEFQQQALVEKFIRGREFAVGLLGNESVETFPVLEIDLDGDPDGIQTAEDKLKKPKEKICPAKIPNELAARMKEESLRVFRALGLKDFARVDIRLDENNNVYILEVNSMASLGKTGSYVTAAKECGYDYTRLVNRMLDVGAMRYFADEFSNKTVQGKTKKIDLSIRLKSYFRSNQTNTQKLLEEMVNINSYVNNIDGVNKIGNIMRKRLGALGFSQEIHSQSQVGNILFFSNTLDEEYDCLFIGNLDNSNKLNNHEYFRISEQKYYGSGVWENKGGLAAMLLALQGLRYTRVLKKLKIAVLLTSDDTMHGSFSRSIIRKKSMKSKLIMGLHGAFIDGGLVTSRSGSALYRLNMSLKNPEDNFDVPFASGFFLKAVNDLVKLSDKKTGVILAPRRMNLDTNITEPYVHGEADISMKFIDDDSFKNIDSKIKKNISVNRYKGKIDFQIEGGMRRPSMSYGDKSMEFMEKINVLADKLDIKVSTEHRWSSANISLADGKMAKIDGFGPNGAKEKKGHEYILKHTLSEKALLMAKFLDELRLS